MSRALRLAAWFMLGVFLGTFLTFVSARADDERWWLVATVTSYHYDRSKDHNEWNRGLGLEYSYNKDWNFNGGTYVNSMARTSNYIGVTYHPFHYGFLNAGVCICLVTGYKDDKPHTPELIPVPVIGLEGKRLGANIGVSPSMLGLQLKARF